MDTQTVRKFRMNLRRLEQLIVTQLREDTCCHGVSVAQCHCLLAVELLDRPSQNELADHLGLDKSTLSRTVEGLVKIGLLERTTDDIDRRMTRIGLSGQGQVACSNINEANDGLYGKVLEAMECGAKTAVKVIEDLVAAMILVKKDSTNCPVTVLPKEMTDGK